MRRFTLLLGLTLPVLFAAPRDLAAQQADIRPGIAVLEFSNGGSYGPKRENLEDLRVGMQQMLLTELQQNPAIRIVERSALKQLVEEQNLATSGRVDASTAAQLGRLVGARYVVLGSFTDLFGEFRLDGRIVDVETGEVVRSTSVQAKRTKMYPMVVELAQKITSGAKLPPLAARVVKERSARAVPPEAVVLFANAQVFADLGETGQAAELYRRIVREFPQYTEAREALQQLSAS
jgi:TolB-like protein